MSKNVHSSSPQELWLTRDGCSGGTLHCPYSSLSYSLWAFWAHLIFGCQHELSQNLFYSTSPRIWCLPRAPVWHVKMKSQEGGKEHKLYFQPSHPWMHLQVVTTDDWGQKHIVRSDLFKMWVIIVWIVVLCLEALFFKGCNTIWLMEDSL